MAILTRDEQAALRRLVQRAKLEGHDARRVAEFLLAWWSPGQFGGFDLTALWGCDSGTVEDLVTVFTFIGRNRVTPEELGFKVDFAAIAGEWRFSRPR